MWQQCPGASRPGVWACPNTMATQTQETKTPTECHADCQEMQYMHQLSQHTQNNADRHSLNFVWYLICSPLVRSYAYGHPPPPSIRQWSCVSSAFQWQPMEAMARKSHARTAKGCSCFRYVQEISYDQPDGCPHRPRFSENSLTARSRRQQGIAKQYCV